MKIKLSYGDVMRLAESYGNAREKMALNSDKVGDLAGAHEVLQKAVKQLEYLAFKQPPCRICVNSDAPPVGLPCADCIETSAGWSGFTEATR